MSELRDKIAKIIYDNSEFGWEKSSGETAAEIVELFEAERKPDTLTVPEAVERLVNFFSEWDIYTTCITMPDRWEIKFVLNGWKTNPPDYVMAIENGRTAAAVRVGLEDLFVTILGGES